MPNKDELIPLLITRGAILYPGCSVILNVGRVFSINAVNLALSDNDGKIALISQVNPDDDHIDDSNIYGQYFVTPYCKYDLNNGVCELGCGLQVDFKNPKKAACVVAEFIKERNQSKK
jgi:ATP-dependent Lon protease